MLRTLKFAALAAVGVVVLAGCGDTVTPVPDATPVPTVSPGACYTVFAKASATAEGVLAGPFTVCSNTSVVVPVPAAGPVRCAVIDAGTHRSVTVGVGDRAVVNGVLAVCETDGYWRAVS